MKSLAEEIESMADNVFILGAGASKEGGAPLMQNFLDKARELFTTGQVSDWAGDFQSVFDAIGKLQHAHSKAEIDIVNIESVMEAFAMASLLDIEPFNSTKLATAMQRLIAVTLEHSLLHYVDSSTVVHPPEPYGDFCQLVHRLQNQTNPSSTSAILTFNYDCCLDYGFYAVGRDVDYSISDSPTHDSMPLLKLHGSLNWFKEKDSDLILCTDMQTYANGQRPMLARIDRRNPWIQLRMTGIWKDNSDIALAHMFVPPTSDKASWHQQLKQVWRAAAKHLSEAKNIIVIGYSLPQSDSFFRYLYALGSIGQYPLENFWVFDPDTTGDVEHRFRVMLGPGARSRFRYGELKFSDSISIIDDTLKNRNPDAVGKWWR